MSRAEPYVLTRGATRREGALLPFLACASDTDGALSVCEFTLPGWSAGPVLHVHSAVDEAFYVVSGAVEFQVADGRVSADAGSFAWVPRGVAHTYANAGPEPARVVAIAAPGGIEEMFAEQAAHLEVAGDSPDHAVLDEIARRHGAITLGPPIEATNAPPGCR
jgi:mannose-6-phosphate isomerase-like protein (cupin superfamily)